MDVVGAELLARELLHSLPKRLAHVVGVADCAMRTAEQLDLAVDVVVSGAWLHDVGYAVTVRDTGFHPLDGARFVRSLGLPDVICSLVAHHSCAEIEADLRGLGQILRVEFPRPSAGLLDVLCYCDMVTGPAGERVRVEGRLAEIRSRYGPGDVVMRFIDCAEHDLIETVRRVERRLSTASVS